MCKLWLCNFLRCIIRDSDGGDNPNGDGNFRIPDNFPAAFVKDPGEWFSEFSILESLEVLALTEN
jgi:hypothetical protein